MRASASSLSDAAKVAAVALAIALTGCMSTTVKFNSNGRVAEITHTNLMRVGTAIIDAPRDGGASVATTAQAMSEQMAGVLKAGIDKAPDATPFSIPTPFWTPTPFSTPAPLLIPTP